MKIEVEIDENVLKELVNDAAKDALKARATWYSTKEEIKTLVAKLWTVEAEVAVKDAIKDLPAIQQMARECLAKKVESQLKKLMK